MGIGSCDERRGVRGAQPLPQWAVGGAVVLWIYRAWLIVFCDIVGGYSLQIFRSLGVFGNLQGIVLTLNLIEGSVDGMVEF